MSVIGKVVSIQMTDKLFHELWDVAMLYESKICFIEDFKEDTDEEELDKIWTVAHMSVRDMVYQNGFTQVSFCDLFCLNPRTLRSWVSLNPAVRKPCPPYLRLAFARTLGLI